MRVLVAPVYDIGTDWGAEGDSQYGWAETFVRALAAHGHFVYWVVLDRYVPAIPSDLTRVKILTQPHPPGDMRGQFSLRHQLPDTLFESFASPMGPKFVDLVVTNDAFYGVQLQQYFSSRRLLEPTPVLMYDNYPTIIGWPEQIWVGNDGDESMLFSRALGYCLCETVGCSPYVSARTLDMVMAYAPPLLAKRFMDRRKYVMNFVNTSFSDSLPPVQKFEKFSCYFGGRFTATKGGERSVKQYLQLMMAGRDVGIYVTAVGGAKRLRDVLKHYGATDAVTVLRNASYREAVEVMRRCHVAIFYQLNPGAGAPYEWMYNGLVVLFKRYDFPEEDEQMPPGYPFWFRTDEECATMLRWVYEHPAEAAAQMEALGVREWCRTKVDELAETARIVDMGQAVVNEHHAKVMAKPGQYDGDTINLVERALNELSADGPVPFPTLVQAIDRVAGRPVMAKTFSGTVRGVHPSRLYRHLIPAGWVDDCETDVARYVKAESDAS